MNSWFDEEYYGTQKVLQMNAMSYDPEWLASHGASEWNIELYREYLDAWRTPEGKPVTAYENFLACNGKDYGAGISQADVNVSCNPLFEVDYYLQSVVDWANTAGAYSAAGIEPGEWTAANMLAHITNDLHMSLWEHFREFGMASELNPSAGFDTHAYLQDRLAAMNAEAGASIYTIEDAIAACKAAGANPVMDFCEYGAAKGIEATPVTTVAPPKPVIPPSSGSSGADGSVSPGGGSSSGSGGGSSPDTGNGSTDDSGNGASPGDSIEIIEPDFAGDCQLDRIESFGGDIFVDVAASGAIASAGFDSSGGDIYVKLSAGGMVSTQLFDARGDDGAGDVTFAIDGGTMLQTSAYTSIYGNALSIDLRGVDALDASNELCVDTSKSYLQLWADSAVTCYGGDMVEDWVILRTVGAGDTLVDLGDAYDTMQLFDTSAWCEPYKLDQKANISVDFGRGGGAFWIGNVYVEPEAIQVINIETEGYQTHYKIGQVTGGKLILSVKEAAKTDTITSVRDNIYPQEFNSDASALEALQSFGIDADLVTRTTWSPIGSDATYSVLVANDNYYVIFDQNCMLELVGLGAVDMAE